jgi:Hemerythrin HHE cation binding domain
MQPAVVQLEERRHRALAVAEGRRFDLYANIHKGIRAFMGATLASVGRLDPADPGEITATLAEVRSLVGFLRGHLHHENQFLHAALEARRPGASRQTAHDHVEHERALERLEGLVLAVERAEDEARPLAAMALYRELALVAADNHVHMNVEETDNTAALWATYSDEELAQIQESLMAAVPPAEMALALRWMLPAIAPAERAGMLTLLQAKLPAPAFQGILSALRPNLSERAWAKLGAALGPVASFN